MKPFPNLVEKAEFETRNHEYFQIKNPIWLHNIINSLRKKKSLSVNPVSSLLFLNHFPISWEKLSLESVIIDISRQKIVSGSITLLLTRITKIPLTWIISYYAD